MSQPFVKASKEGKSLSSGGGVAPIEIMLLASVSRAMNPKRILIIGNAFGWSTLAIGLACPDARVVAMDALVEGSEAQQGFDLTNTIIEGDGLSNISVVQAFSPNDVDDVCRQYFDGPVDLVLIDGEHSNDQQRKDFDAVQNKLSDSGLIFLHDVLNWNMVSEQSDSAAYPNMQGKILMRTPSGMGAFHTSLTPIEAQQIIDAFVNQPRQFEKSIVKCNKDSKYALCWALGLRSPMIGKKMRCKLVKND